MDVVADVSEVHVEQGEHKWSSQCVRFTVKRSDKVNISELADIN
jgi:hypothetical protein